MAFNEAYRNQVALLIRVLPLVAEEDCFALKGGTAINLFVRNMPRLSVDIDLTYTPVQPRPQSLAAIDAALKRIAANIRQTILQSEVVESALAIEGAVTKLFVRAGGVQTIVEVTPVMRGCVFDPTLRAVSNAVEAEFGFAEIRVLSFADLYGGKLVAALDRQHPRDLFDGRDLLANEGIDDALRHAFIVYLLSHSRPMGEVLRANRLDIAQEYARGFEGMTVDPVPLDALIAAREAIVQGIVGDMPVTHRRFLMSFERGEPDWPLLGVDGAQNLPAVLWRQQNLGLLTAERRAGLVANLADVLGMPVAA